MSSACASRRVSPVLRAEDVMTTELNISWHVPRELSVHLHSVSCVES